MKAITLGPVVTLVVVFLLGGIAGAGVAVAYVHHQAREFSEPRFRDRARVHGLTRLLDLTDGQRDRVKAVLEKHQGDRQAAFSEMVDRCGDSVKKQKAQVDAEIRSILNPAQQEKFDALLKRQDERFSSGARGPL